jgi:ethanolamine ammonia-lyase small subunit
VIDRPPSVLQAVVPASWAALRKHTPARIAIGRAGSSLPTGAYLEFQAAHARARDAVHAALDVDAMVQSIAACGWPVIPVRSAAEDRQVYLRMPDLGRRLCAESRARLSEPMIAPDVVIVVGDGLSSVAVERNAVAVLRVLFPRLQAAGLQVAPIIVAVQARVALSDEVGELLQAKAALILIGERPGLSAADSLGIYLTFTPRVGRVDSERNCISNIREGGMPAADAAAQATDLIRARCSSIELQACRSPPESAGYSLDNCRCVSRMRCSTTRRAGIRHSSDLNARRGAPLIRDHPRL